VLVSVFVFVLDRVMVAVDVFVWVEVSVEVLVVVDVVAVLPAVFVFAALVAVASAVCALDEAPASALLACWATVPVPPDPHAARAITHTTAAPPKRSNRTMSPARDPATGHLRLCRAMRIGPRQCQGAPCG
jgi:hypothetical protein